MASSFDSQLTARRIHELLILSVLARAPMHGYQIALDVEERSGGYFRFQHGTLYPILHRLEQEGVIGGDWSDPAQGRARKQYSLTKAGRRRLAGNAREWEELTQQVAAFIDPEDGDAQVRTGAA
ncbi:MAG: PadR family transcriptional regulator [Longimicrobiales bacterium]